MKCTARENVIDGTMIIHRFNVLVPGVVFKVNISFNIDMYMRTTIHFIYLWYIMMYENILILSEKKMPLNIPYPKDYNTYRTFAFVIWVRPYQNLVCIPTLMLTIHGPLFNDANIIFLANMRRIVYPASYLLLNPLPFSFHVNYHDDVIKWKHFPRYVLGIHWSHVNSSHKGQWRGALMFSLICDWINSWVNNREAGDLRTVNYSEKDGSRIHISLSLILLIIRLFLISL